MCTIHSRLTLSYTGCCLFDQRWAGFIIWPCFLNFKQVRNLWSIQLLSWKLVAILEFYVVSHKVSLFCLHRSCHVDQVTFHKNLPWMLIIKFVCNLSGFGFALHPCRNTCWQQWRSRCSWWRSPTGCQEGRRQLQTRVYGRNRPVKVCVTFSYGKVKIYIIARMKFPQCLQFEVRVTLSEFMN